jgi:hypothetical protein
MSNFYLPGEQLVVVAVVAVDVVVLGPRPRRVDVEVPRAPARPPPVAVVAGRRVSFVGGREPGPTRGFPRDSGSENKTDFKLQSKKISSLKKLSQIFNINFLETVGSPNRAQSK